MEIRIDNSTQLEEWFCPVYKRKIDAGLCFDVSNIGDDSLCLTGNEKPPCSWTESHKICDSCRHYTDWN